MLLAGCSIFDRIINVDTAPIERPQLVVPDIEEFNSRPIQWIVVTEDNVQQIFDDLKAQNVDIALFALTDGDYENLALNMGDIIKLIQQQKAIIAAYKQYYETQE